MKRILGVLFGFLVSFQGYAQFQSVQRGPDFPDIPGFLVLKCDPHMHTVFSDADLWPSARIAEAVSDGLEVVAITDHVEYRPKLADLSNKSHNRSYELAKGPAEAAGILLIPGIEITRGAPAGHFNALFIQDADPLEQYVNRANWQDNARVEEAIGEMVTQNAFIFWNHPYFPTLNGVAEMTPLHEKLIKNKVIRGIEVMNGETYEPKAFAWCLQYDLAIIGSSDVHAVMWDEIKDRDMLHRSITLILAKERTSAGAREAFEARRTVALGRNTLYGREAHVKPLFEASVQWHIASLNGNKAMLHVQNLSGIPYTIEFQDTGSLKTIKGLTVEAHGTTFVPVTLPEGTLKEGPHTLKVLVKNILTAPGQALICEVHVMKEK